MKRKLPPHRARRQRRTPLLLTAVLLTPLLSPAGAQDIRGMEVCTAETKMERRTGCLQSNVDFLQQELNKLARETQDKIAAARAEIATLRSTVEKLKGELAEMKAKPEPAAKK
jgi:seryl-tRNA synthetase